MNDRTRKKTKEDWDFRDPCKPPVRTPKHGFGMLLRVRSTGFQGRVDAIYVDYWSALNSHAIPSGWFEMQNKPIPGGRDQVFYSLAGVGQALAGELDVEVVT